MTQARQGDCRAWWWVAGLLIAAFLARAPLYLAVRSMQEMSVHTLTTNFPTGWSFSIS